jgi:molybdopterin-guanine dinucleotide biosynthesis protein A
VRLLSQVVSPVIVVGAASQDLPPLPADVIITRDPAPARGPLVGLAAGLAAVTAEAAYVSSCDVPLLRPAFVRRMINLLGDFDAAVPEVDGRLHPLAAVYRREVRTIAESLLSSGERRLTHLLSVLRTRIVTAAELAEADPGLSSLRNVNTPDDLAAAVRDARGWSSTDFH